MADAKQMIPREAIDRIYATARIEDVVGDYVSLRRRGANLWGLCPFHDEKTPSFSVSPAKGIYKCFGCGKGGNAVNFVMEAEQMTYPDALRQLAKKYHIDFKEKELTEEEKREENERESLFKVNEWANEWFQQQLNDTDEGQSIAMRYFVERGLREDIVKKFSLGYSPDRNALYEAATKAGYQAEFLEKTGLCGKTEQGRYYDRFRDRVIFPIHTVSGKTVAFAGRILRKKEHVGKYVNSPDSLIYSKQRELYGLFLGKQAITKENCCYLVEGQMDVISMHQAGIENVVSSGGTALTHRQILLLHRFTENVTVLYDGDAAGIHAALRGIDMLLEEGLNIKVVLLPDGEDPDSMSRRMNAVDFQQFLHDNQQDFIRFKTNLLLQDAGSDPIKKSEVIKSIVQSIAVIPDLITRQVYQKDCSTLLDIREDVLLKEINKIRREKYSKEQTNKTEPNGTTQNNPEPQGTTQNNPEPQGTTLNNLEPQGTTPNNPEPHGTTPNNPEPPKTTSKLQQNILNLLQVLVRYGTMPLFTMENGEVWNVGQFVLNELDADQISFSQYPLYQRVLDEYREQMQTDGFVPEQYFKFHHDSEMALLAVELISDKYDLSKIYSKQNISENVQTEAKLPTDADRLTDLVPRLLLELKDTMIEEQMTFIRYALKHASENHQTEEEINLITQLTQLQQLRRLFSESLGKRVIV